MKRVEALEAGRVAVGADGVVVNGVPLAGTRPIETDGRGRTIARIAPGTWHIGPGEFWAGSSAHPHSFDSRYFGPVPVDHVRGVSCSF